MFFNGRGTCRLAHKCKHCFQISDFWSIYRLSLSTTIGKIGLENIESHDELRR
jgi:hypothetical protein